MASMSRIPLPLTALAIALPGLLHTGQGHAAPVCVFESGSFSEGARICAEPGLLMVCSISGDRAVWTVSTDRDLGGVCAATPRRGAGRAARRHAGQRTAAGGAPTTPDNAKCFTFNGKRYCE
jgi:hypothetical protein